MKTEECTNFSFSETLTKFEACLKEHIKTFGRETPLRNACEYALINGGKRVRPLIVFMVADALGKKADVSLAALSIEYFHAASLIVDDLPCMDNDDFRRNKPSTHRVFGESTALLASFSLFTAGFQKIQEAVEHLGDFSQNVCGFLLKQVSLAAGIEGTIGGQHLDLFEENISLNSLNEIIEKKTVKLFEIAFLYGWIFGGGDVSQYLEVKRLGFHFGMAFQIADDIKDFDQDLIKERPVNMAVLLGKEQASIRFYKELEEFNRLLSMLGIANDSFGKLANYLEEYLKEEKKRG